MSEISNFNLNELFLVLVIFFILFLIHRINFHKRININLYFLSYFLITFFLISITLIFNFESYQNSIFFPGDLFADGLKVTYSYNHIFDTNELDVFGAIYNGNPFLSKIPNTDFLYNVHTLPLTSIKFQLAAYLINFFNISHPFFIFFYFIIYSLVVIKNFSIIQIYSDILSYAYLLLSTLSYPILFLYQRGNFTAGIALQLVLTSFLIFKRDKKLNWKILISFMIALNFRPNYILLIPAFYFSLPVLKQIYESIKLFILFLISFFSFLFIANHMYPNYSLSSFLIGAGSLREYHLDGGDGFDSSIFRVLQRILDPLGANLVQIFNLTLAVGLIIVLFVFLNKYFDENYKLYMLCFISLVFSFPIGDYHLLVLLLPMLKILLEKDTENYYLVFLILLIFLPIPHFLNFNQPSYSNFFNVTVFLYSLIFPYIQKKV